MFYLKKTAFQMSFLLLQQKYSLYFKKLLQKIMCQVYVTIFNKYFMKKTFVLYVGYLMKNGASNNSFTYSFINTLLLRKQQLF